MVELADIPTTEEEVSLGPLANSLGLLVRLAQIKTFEDYFASIGNLGVRPGEISVLVLIGENPGIRQGLLAQRLMIKRAHMTKMVRAMEEDGLVRRRVPEHDKRSVELRLTDKGSAKVRDLRRPFLLHERRSTENLMKREEEELKRLLRKFLGLHTNGAEEKP